MFVIFYRTIILYFVVLAVIRLMGKGELSNMSPFQMVVLFMIADLASIPIESTDYSILYGVVAIGTLTMIEVLISFLSIKSEKLKILFNGLPSLLIDQGHINYKEMKRHRITINDLVEQIRLCEVPSISDVDFAIMESNGDLSVIKKSLYDTNQTFLPTVLISDGVLYKRNLSRTNWTEDSLLSKLEQKGYSDIKSIFMLFSDDKSNLHIYIKDQKSGYAMHSNL